MINQDDYIDEINLNVLVDGVPKRLDIPVPFDYDGEEIIQVVMNDISPIDENSFTRAGAEDDGASEDICDYDLDGQMDADAYNDWQQRAQELERVDISSSALESTGLTPGDCPGLADLYMGEITTLFLDEAIERDLHNAEIVASNTKAAFRAMRETCGASQAALADALGVNVRAVKRWETPGQPEPPSDARRLVESWYHDALIGARWHMRQAEELRGEYHEAYTLVLYRNQEEFDQVLAPLLANAPSYRWQDAIADAKQTAPERDDPESALEAARPYTNFPGTRSYWRANAAARLAAVLMDASGLPYGFAYLSEQRPSLYWEGLWVPRADVQRIETPSGTMVVCGMR